MSDETTEFDERYVRFREHAKLSERVTAVEGQSTRIEAQLSRIETAVARAPLTAPTAPQETAAALALHRALDAFDNKRSGSTPTLVLALAIIGAIALAAGGFWLMGHH